ncbi:MAG: tRNA (guanosine(37)-N1)-methyltransferase TrmD [Clostridiales bacterium]|nr:tRNA (guanosine(37)-N1)-methyltransferase TrmD [Clostridiales bacterium]
MRFDIMTLFPGEVDAFLSSSVIGRARSKGIIEIECHDIRNYAKDKHRHVDDYPYGGGVGMVMQVEPILLCYNDIKKRVPDTYCIYMSPKGKKLTQTRAKKLLSKRNITLLCGHYEGVDQRAIDLIVDEEISIGDYVLSGGELGAMVLVDCVARMVDGVLSEKECYEDESIASGLLEYPQYTRPADYNGIKVPDVLLSGHEANIKKWRLEQSLSITKERRKDLYNRYVKRKK